MKLFWHLQWQQFRYEYSLLLIAAVVASFFLSYDSMSEMQLLIFAYTLTVSNMAAAPRIIASRQRYRFLRSLPIRKQEVTRYFIYTQLLFTITCFTLIAPMHFYAAHVQQQWDMFTLSFCAAFSVCLLGHLIILPHVLKNIEKVSMLYMIVVMIIAMIVMYPLYYIVLSLFTSIAVPLMFILAASVLLFYLRWTKRYMHIEIYENKRVD
ncbi:hypothetical protein [Caryophanon latum]|uniref:Uncharacterized protein n=1 Tax=Caryophanon latum TaxID=33977 RepID=A0A1C0YPI7_9BACL|nr:hypothetical protein [Caryophanon latum]OCS89078.1 hypothetical protein A6K76_13140 [Caryophanon latum]